MKEDSYSLLPSCFVPDLASRLDPGLNERCLIRLRPRRQEQKGEREGGSGIKNVYKRIFAI